MAALVATRQQPVRASAGATPDKCKLEMSAADFRSWRRSVEAWVCLAKWQEQEAVLHIRLLCAADLQPAPDAKFTTQQWKALSVSNALDAIGKMVLRLSIQAKR